MIGRFLLGRMQTGPVLVDLGRMRGQEWAVLAGGINILIALSNIFEPDADGAIAHGAEALFYISIGCFFIFIGLRKVQLRVRAFVHQQFIIPWDKIHGYHWEADRPGTLTLMVNTWVPFRSQQTVSVPFEQCDIVDAILAQRVPSTSALPHQRAT